MKIVLATGIYPPEIGGPATYVRALAKELIRMGHEIIVITYGAPEAGDGFSVHGVSKTLPVVRWFLYSRILRKYADDADVVVAFSSISAGVPMWLARLKTPIKILRLGGDFFWERYTDRGGMMSLREWYEKRVLGIRYYVSGMRLMHALLKRFDHIVFSTRFQLEIYERSYRSLPPHSVIENALPSITPRPHEKHMPFRLLFMGRFVAFKNLISLLKAVSQLDGVTLTLVGDGPMKPRLVGITNTLCLNDRVRFMAPVNAQVKEEVMLEHDLMIIPSITEISPNAALEARASGLPVLLTEETGLSNPLTQGMMLMPLRDVHEIVSSVRKAMDSSHYEDLSEEAYLRPWQKVCEQWIELFLQLL